MGNAKKGKFLAANGDTKAVVEDGFPLLLNGNIFTSTVRMIDCEILIHGMKCTQCQCYHPQLRAMYSRYKQNELVTCNSKYTNNKYLKSPEKTEKLKTLQIKVLEAEKKIKSLKLKMSKMSSGVSIDEGLHTDLLDIAEQHNTWIMELFPVGSFRRLFWEEQVKAAKLSDARQMRWYPMMIRWCLNLKLLSTSAYHSMRTSGFIKLPSERTLRDYTSFLQAKVGFQDEVDKMLLQEAQLDKLPAYKRYVVLLFDEMKVSENLVYDKHQAQVIGFVQLGKVDDELAQLEQGGDSYRLQSKCSQAYTYSYGTRSVYQPTFPICSFCY